MPYIEGAMEHIQRIYEWNERVDEMRMQSLVIPSIKDYYAFGDYDFKNGLRMYYEERGEFTTAMLQAKTLDAIDALVDQFVVAIGEIRKCALSESYEHIHGWEEKSLDAYSYLRYEISGIIYSKYNDDDDTVDTELIWDLRHKAITEVIDALFTRFWDDCYIDDNGKFKKSTDFQEPDLSFLQ